MYGSIIQTTRTLADFVAELVERLTVETFALHFDQATDSCLNWILYSRQTL